MSFDSVNSLTSLFIAQLDLLQEGDYPQARRESSNDESFAFHLFEEDFEMYLRGQTPGREGRILPEPPITVTSTLRQPLSLPPK